MVLPFETLLDGVLGSIFGSSLLEIVLVFKGLGTICFSLKNVLIFSCTMDSKCGSSSKTCWSNVASSISAGFSVEISSIDHLNFPSDSCGVKTVGLLLKNDHYLHYVIYDF